MTEAIDSEIDIAQLMADIRLSVEKREAEGKMSLGSASVELRHMLAKAGEFAAPSQELLPVRLQPDFEPQQDDHYHVADLLKYHDHTFIRNAYRAILKREPDENDAGLKEFSEELRSGRLNKIDVLARILASREGQSKGVQVDGLARPAAMRRLYRVPILGYLLEMLTAIARLPKSLRSQRQFETHALAQQQQLADHLNQLSRVTLETSESFSRELVEISREQRDFTRLRHQQMAGMLRNQREVRELLKAQKGVPAGETRMEPPAASQSHGKLDDFFAAFADEFRGDPEEVKAGLLRYLPYIRSAEVKDGILDIGCGRGEWLELLKEENLPARGIEINSSLAGQLRAGGFDVVEGNALDYLRGLPEGSVNVVTAFHFIEHLSFEIFIELLDEITRVLRPGGLLIFETPNPKNLVVAACNFYSDPSHVRPFFPETLHFILSQRGFVDVRLDYVNPVDASPFEGDSKSSEALRSWFYSPRDFAVIGTKAI